MARFSVLWKPTFRHHKWNILECVTWTMSWRLTSRFLHTRYNNMKAGPSGNQRNCPWEHRILGTSIIKRLHGSRSAPRCFHYLDRKIQQMSPSELRNIPDSCGWWAFHPKQRCETWWVSNDPPVLHISKVNPTKLKRYLFLRDQVRPVSLRHWLEMRPMISNVNCLNHHQFHVVFWSLSTWEGWQKMAHKTHAWEMGFSPLLLADPGQPNN